MFVIEQGDVLSVEKMRGAVLVVSKNFFNREEAAIVCPIVEDARPDPLHVKIKTENAEGFVLCEQMKLLDLKIRGFKRLDRIKYAEIIDITDAIQSIFDY